MSFTRRERLICPAKNDVSLVHCLAPRYITYMMWRRIVGLGICLLAVCTSSEAAPAPSQPNQYTIEISRTLFDLQRKARTHKTMDGLEVFTNVEHMIPPNGIENLQSLVNILDEQFSLWNPKEGRTVHIYFLDYETFCQYADRVNKILGRYLWPGARSPHPEDMYAFFIPLTAGEDVIITYTWDWNVLLHELMHTVLYAQVSFLTATNHAAVNPEVARMWYSDDVKKLVRKATKGERYE